MRKVSSATYHYIRTPPIRCHVGTTLDLFSEPIELPKESIQGWIFPLHQRWHHLLPPNLGQARPTTRIFSRPSIGVGSKPWPRTDMKSAIRAKDGVLESPGTTREKNANSRASLFQRTKRLPPPRPFPATTTGPTSSNSSSRLRETDLGPFGSERPNRIAGMNTEAV